VPDRMRPKYQHQGPAWHCKHQGKQLGWVSCTAYAMAMGIDRATNGGRTPTGCEVRELTKDFVNGLSLDEVADAAAEFHVRVTVKHGPHAIAPEKAAVQCRLGRGFVLQGNADVLRNTPFRATKGAVNHAVWVNRIRGGTREKPAEARVFDPAADGRSAPWGTAVKGPSWWPWETVLAFAASLRINDNGKKLGPGKMYAGFIDAPPTGKAAIHVAGQPHPPVPDVILANHAVKTKPFPDRMRADPPPGRTVNVRKDPRSLAADDIVDRLSDGTLFIAFQRIDDGARPGGSSSRIWYGNHDGDQWIHESGLRHIGGPS
jgi:hypothetical protein